MTRESTMSSAHHSPHASGAQPSRDGFTALDACHRQTLVTLDMLDALVSRLQSDGPDDQARVMAKEIVHFFSTTARQHHEDEERHIFPAMLTSTDPDIVQTVQRLQQDHRWLEEDWIELGPQIDAVAGGQSWVDLDIVREWVTVFSALSHDHVELEESCIYPQARARLDASERHEMGREMAARRRRQEDQT
jgi:hemerythrin-like domain-containing protein